MIGYIVVGAKGKGKSSFVQNKILSKVKKNNIFIYNINNEEDYNQFYELPERLQDIEAFASHVKKFKGAVIVFEEATIFFNSRSANKMVTDLLVRSRHTKNMIIFCFHSVRSIPLNIYEICDYITVFKTQDSIAMTNNQLKDERLTALMESVSKEHDSGNIHYYETLKIR